MGDYSLANMSEHGSSNDNNNSGSRPIYASSSIPMGHIATPSSDTNNIPTVAAYQVSNLPQAGTEAWRTNWYDLHIFLSPFSTISKLLLASINYIIIEINGQ